MSSEYVFSCAGRPRLSVDLRSGSLFIRGWSGNEVRVSCDAKPNIHQEGDTVIIEGSQACDLKVYMPTASDVYIDGTNLDIDMGGICGEGVVDVTSGHINIEAWQGDVEIDGTGCEIQCFHCQGQVNIDTSKGDVIFISCEGNLSVDTSSGFVKAENCSGSLEADTGSGDVILRQFRGPVHIDTGNGNVELKGISGRNVYVDCGGGSIEAVLPGGSPGRWQLCTRSGTISLAVPENTSARFEFEGPSLDLEELALKHSSRDQDQVTGSLGSGQGLVTVASSRGGIVARRLPASVILEAQADPGAENDEEILKILTMLENGAITTAEAEELLDALRGDVDDLQG